MTRIAPERKNEPQTVMPAMVAIVGTTGHRKRIITGKTPMGATRT